MAPRWLWITGVWALLGAVAGCSGGPSCLEAGKSRCEAICACNPGPQCVVTSTYGNTIQTLFQDQRDCEVLAELVCLAQDDPDPDPECAAALPSAECFTVFEEEDQDRANPLEGLNLPAACR